ncbi:MAG TPA: F0F1 ATP synthase subunit A [Bacteroidales bacterium]|jgi:F-type H+-transporting ATPase subunit a|nr:F0F1 ATP synthase subunit A [Bacteroidales bacterium]HRS18383.1 F0F1 ATP synthase subunit A [Bacteroidales bacterium]
MAYNTIKRSFFTLGIVLLFSLFSIASEQEHAQANQAEKGEVDVNKAIFDHIGDNHDWHLWDITHADGTIHPVTIPLPIILINTKPFSITTFMSSEFHHGHSPVTKGKYTYLMHEQKIYYANPDGSLQYDEKGSIISAKPIDISITKNVSTLFLAALLMILIFTSCAKAYTRRPGLAPKGLQGFMEPIILFVKDDIVIPNIGEKKHAKFLPYLLTVFFFIWILNMIGLIPFFPGSANVTGNIAVTFVLALFTLIITNVNGNKDYWKHIFAMPGLPLWLLPIMIVVELIGVIAKPFALMIRLFANITAGHIVVLSLVSLIFVFQTLAIAPVSVAFVLFMDVLELFVAALQAYIFTMLSALFIGLAVQEHHH